MDKKIAFIILLIVALFNLILCICIGAFFFAAVPIVCTLLWFFRYRKKAANCTPEVILLSLLMLAGLAVTQPFSGMFSFQYPSQKFYVEKKSNADLDGLFPEKLPKSTGKFHTEFVPSIMQGSGYYYVMITADNIEVDAIRKEAVENAMLICSLEDLGDEYEDHENEQKITSADLYIPDKFRKSPKAECYIISVTGNWNHPHSKLVIIDGQNVCWSKLG